ncbi:beta-N-acetylhexosaminidase [Propionivibrio dicarboxylicus]|uniref:Beta-hexosaminidase n=1 Tax=Propionivibrio dicarboxylicus TaxID=83767 RepID=A0A1G8D499_9RHOO|nr:beta-N-acetylhexosaminidase [Propionivibrio dicarboxylicus]SDH52373.1 beta-N-acetylhexosaminidase [Propionivibrio dicarboxylicus]
MTAVLELPHGPLMIDIGGIELTDADRVRLQHPLVGGLILFSRNFKSTEQLARLAEEIHKLRSPRLLIAIDHEGGRVQRCREGFTRLPPMRSLGRLWEEAPQRAVQAARDIGFVLAAELRMCNVDLSFTPVLDLDWGRSSVIGDRAFHGNPDAVIELAGGLIEGLHRAGMSACGKHFPGHGWATADSHVAMPVDERDLDALQEDIKPYRHLALDAVMPAHVIYPCLDEKTSGFSSRWNAFLRNNINFDGVVFSDDLSMEGASVAGDVVARTEAAWSAGCDMLLLCNASDAVDQVLERWHPTIDRIRSNRIARLLPLTSPIGLSDDTHYRDGINACQRLISRFS